MSALLDDATAQRPSRLYTGFQRPWHLTGEQVDGWLAAQALRAVLPARRRSNVLA